MTLIGMDVGTTSVKAVKLSGDGEVVGKAAREYPFATPRPGWTEQDPVTWWDAARGVLDELDTDGVEGIGLSGQMHGLVALDDAGEVIRPAILWNDQRTAAECDEIENALGRERLIELTGNRALTGFTAPKLLWLRNNERAAFDRIARVLLPKDYVRYRLTGELAGDVSDCSGTLLFDVGARTWSDEVLAKLDLDPAWMPRVHESPDVSGTTHDGVPVAAGAGDQAAGAIGVGVDKPGVLSVALGTSGVVFAALPTYEVDDEARLHVFCHAVPGSWHAMGVTLSAAGSLRWLRDALATDDDFESLLRRAEKWEPTTEGLTFLPYLAGERTPHADVDARASFTGLSLRHDTGALVRAVLEGVAY
ncbi:MAG: xylulokinase, partial [Actinomycetota bacterium]